MRSYEFKGELPSGASLIYSFEADTEEDHCYHVLTFYRMLGHEHFMGMKFYSSNDEWRAELE